MIDNEKNCQCPNCISGEFYDPADYYLDIPSLDDERERGVSGILNTRSDASTIAACIESCIHSLDELVITYNCPLGKHLDNTLDILKEKKEKYPEKITLSEYHVEFDCTIDQGERIGDHLYKTGIHTQANMHNLGMQRAKYSHYCRIDGDQIYFPAYLKLVVDSIKSGGELLDVMGKSIDHELTDLLPRYNLSMINIFPFESTWYVPTEHTFQREPFSGNGDHVIHKINSKSLYATKTDLNHKFMGPDFLVPYERQRQKGARQLMTNNWIGWMSFHCKHVALHKRYNQFAEDNYYINHYRDNIFLPNKEHFEDIEVALTRNFEQFKGLQPEWILAIWERSWEQRSTMVDVTPLKEMDDMEFYPKEA